MHPMLNIAIRAARKAGNVIANYYEAFHHIESDKKNKSDFMINIDKTAEEIIVRTIRKSYPQHAILTKEINEYKNSDQNILWVIDPLDGIVNFINHLPYFAVSIAVQVKGNTEIAVVYDPMRNELFTAVRGQGAHLNGYRLRSDKICDLNDLILAIGFSFKNDRNRITYIKIFDRLLTICTDFRRIGSTALNLVYVAAARVDGCFEVSLNSWSFVAGELIIRESGTLACDFTGEHNYITTKSIVAGNSRIIKLILNIIRNNLSER